MGTMSDVGRADLVVHSATVLTGEGAPARVDDATITVRDGRIAAIEPNGERPPAARTVDGRGHVVTPGFVNVHTHAILTMVRGVAEDMGFAPAYTPGVPHGHEVTRDEAVALARLGALEALLFGSTLINDTYVHADAVTPAMAELGLRVWSCGRIHDVDFSRVHEGVWRHEAAIGERTLAEALDLHARWHGAANGRIGVQLSPHAPDTCTRRLLEDVREAAATRGLRVNTHLSQSKLENERIREREGCTPAELLDDVGLLNDRLIAAHCMHMTADDIDRVGRAGITLAHIPKGNATGGLIAPTRALAEAGVNLALGTDNMHADMVEVMRWALVVGRLQAGGIDETWQPATALAMATVNGARAMGLDHDLGTLAVGKKADFVLFDFRRPHLVPHLCTAGNLLHTAQGRDVAMVVVDGEIVVEDGRPLKGELETITADGQRAAEALWTRARARVA
jgi:5-methylthioadenosine/S-adenosylhomocysteine deaminase